MSEKSDWKHKAEALGEKGILDNSVIRSLKKMFNSPDKENAELARGIIVYKIKDVLTAGLNAGQRNAFAHIVEFMLTQVSEYDAVLLTGFAGTGKTFLVRRVIEFLHLAYPGWSGAITAPTNKAVHVLTKNSPYFVNANMFEAYGKPSDKITFCTSHKLLGLKEVITSEGRQKFVSSKEGSAAMNYDYIVGDETSMLDDQRYDDIMSFCKRIKILLMGDPLQIPPINRLDAKPFTDKPGYNLLKLHLDEPMRQKGDHPVLDLGIQVRNNIDKKVPVPVIKTKINTDGNGVIYLNGKTERSRLRPIIKRLFNDPQYKDSPNFVKIIAYRNKSVAYLNSVVKECIFGKGYATYEVGEHLIANKALFQSGYCKFTGVRYGIKANTSDEFKVTSVSLIPRTIKEKYRRGPSLVFTGKFWKLDCKRLRGKRDEYVTLYVIHEDSRKEWEALAKEVKKTASERSDKDWWVSYYNILKWSDNITYNYAITAHKSQGSNIQNVIFIEEDLRVNRKTRERNRIIYTAYTRCVGRLYIMR